MRSLTLKPVGGYRSPAPHRRSSGTPVKPYRLTSNVPHQGKRELERRRAQLERARKRAGQSTPQTDG